MYEWKTLFPMTSLGNGMQLFKKKKVSLKKEAEDMFSADVIDRKTYHVKVKVKADSSSYKIRCDCPMAIGGQYCRHMAAALYAMEDAEVHPDETLSEEEEETSSAVPLCLEKQEKDPEQAQDEYITMNGENTAIEMPAVDWNSVDLEHYEYFIGAQIFSSMNFPEKIQREAKKLIKDGKVVLAKLTTGYYEQEEEPLGECYGMGLDGKKEFPICVCFNRTEVLRTDCQCKNCGNHYYFYHFNSP